jgi:RNA polymerase subunit RPABC4/transcription elongation factor Spt4
LAGSHISESTSSGIPDFEFDCPECGLHIIGEANRCPKCGVEFVIEEVAEAECPECGALVPGSAESCPKCGVRFEVEAVQPSAPEAEEPVEMPQPAPEPKPVKPMPSAPVERPEEPAAPEQSAPVEPAGAGEEELRKEFPMLVAEVKPLLDLAKEYEIPSGEGRRLIDKAVRAGKQKDIVAAVSYVKECKTSIQAAIEERVARDIEYLEKLVEIARQINSDPKTIIDSVTLVKAKKEACDLEGALSAARAGKEQAEQLTGKYIEAQELCDGLEKLIQNCERFYVDVREARKLLTEAREAGDHGDWSMMGILAKKAREEILKTLPELLNSELKKAKSVLLDAKAEGKDVSTLVKVLKDAGAAAKREKYVEALDRLIEFKAEAKRV